MPYLPACTEEIVILKSIQNDEKYAKTCYYGTHGGKNQIIVMMSDLNPQF